MTSSFLAIILFGAVAAARQPSTVVFVCEHGAAKSVVAAAYFNRIAQQQHLPFRAVARGTEPQADLAPSAVNGLRADGLQPPAGHPAALTKADLDGAVRVVAFCELPAKLAGDHRKVEQWTAPAVGDGYAAARDIILNDVKVLIESLQHAR